MVVLVLMTWFMVSSGMSLLGAAVRRPAKAGESSIATLLSKIRVKAVKRDKMFPMKPKVLNLNASHLSVAWKRVISLSFGRISGLRNRTRIVQNFVKVMLRMVEHHGPLTTVKWLKACYVALQKACTDDKLGTLRTLEPGLPLPRLISGLPTIIGSQDRKLIKAGHAGVFVFWSSLFSIYRILKVPYVLKVDSITKPFCGDTVFLDVSRAFASQRTFFETLPGFSTWQKTATLAPRTFIMSKSASPSHHVA